MSRGSITLGDVGEHTTVLAVACTRCERAGRYNLDALIARHGFGFGVPKLLHLLSADCPKRASSTARQNNGVTNFVDDLPVPVVLGTDPAQVTDIVSEDCYTVDLPAPPLTAWTARLRSRALACSACPSAQQQGR